MKRIYADFNDLAANGTLPLTCKGSLDSLAAQQGPLLDGEEVLLSDEQELEAVARVFRVADGTWEARAEWGFTPIRPRGMH